MEQEIGVIASVISEYQRGAQMRTPTIEIMKTIKFKVPEPMKWSLCKESKIDEAIELNIIGDIRIRIRRRFD